MVLCYLAEVTRRICATSSLPLTTTSLLVRNSPLPLPTDFLVPFILPPFPGQFNPKVSRPHILFSTCGVLTRS